MKMKTKHALRGFTLIELLIVVAIIAILAAIAVPNFLEAQVRSKVARVHADMRSVATAIEGYAVDYNVAPPGWREHSDQTPYSAVTNMNLERYFANRCAFSRLTTPIAYISSIPHDPFQSKFIKQFDLYENKPGPHPFNYVTYALFGDKYAANNFITVGNLGYTWSLDSPGPGLLDGNICRILKGDAIDKSGTRSTSAYDPTNGTTSKGLIIRTNKGIFEGAGNRGVN